MVRTHEAARGEAVAYARRIVNELIEFEAYFHSQQRFGAVDNAILGIMQMRAEILAEHIDGLETLPDIEPMLLDALASVNATCRVLISEWEPERGRTLFEAHQ